MAGYPQVLGGVTRKLSDSVTIHSTPFKRANYFNFGARMAILELNKSDEYVIWSPLPMSEEFRNCLKYSGINKENDNVINDDNFSQFNNKVVAIIVPDNEHLLSIRQNLKGKFFPNSKIIGMNDLKNLSNNDLNLIDIKFDSNLANKIVKRDQLRTDLNISNQNIINDLEFIYLNGHENKELLMLHKSSKTLFQADLLFNIESKYSEQYSYNLSSSPFFSSNNKDNFFIYPKSPLNDNFTNHNPNSYSSFLTRFLQPNSSLFKNIFVKKLLFPIKSENNKLAIKQIYDDWNFDNIVLCHGNVIEKTGRDVFFNVFNDYLK
ncbi:uncharacterized protein ASCRUDRAFT_123191 [Ascoidea rubescens DSM 1968]|uniref:Uncharacterized protein n=1 Tax=Ascoidea rubescens DSM 1968 TaxID=1344418 RepID=A0A1D2VMD9_9ASCO|nr:hypothetical protein ASCRUDRAFT_123191 [Ascoidea rubescens DSM 1968]ODV62727.1 hypothetical protein ASCRUDRAFT_123191 [Ascoidea rubescens DSM 1968]